MFCKYCGKQLAENVNFCSYCGKKLSEIPAFVEEKPANDKKYCEKCGAENEKTVKFCRSCGASLVNGQESPEKANEVKEETPVAFTPVHSNLPKKEIKQTESTKSRTVAALLAFFFGNFGAHRFYVGKTGSAVLQMALGLSFTISLLVMMVDFIEMAVIFIFLGLAWGIWVLVDFFMILCGSFRDKDNLLVTDWDF